jgi:hypothetical protein
VRACSKGLGARLRRLSYLGIGDGRVLKPPDKHQQAEPVITFAIVLLDRVVKIWSDRQSDEYDLVRPRQRRPVMMTRVARSP